MRAFTAHVGPHLRSSATACTTRSCAASATACRSTRSASPKRSPRTTCRASCSRRSASRCRGRPRPVDPAAGVERGARPAPTVGPAVVAAHPAGARVRDRPARVRRHLRGLPRHRARRPASSTTAAQAELDDVLGARRRVRGHRRDQGPAGALADRAHPPHRGRRAAGRRRQLLHRDGRRRRSAATSTILKVDPAVEAELRDDVDAVARATATPAPSKRRSTSCGASPRRDENLMPATIALAHAGGTTGEWGGALREVFGEFRAPTGVAAAVGTRRRARRALSPSVCA